MASQSRWCMRLCACRKSPLCRIHPAASQGVINLRGKIVSVVDLRRRFGEKEIKPTKKNRILVTEVHGKLVGLIVDSASEVLKIPESDIELPPVFDQGELNYVTGVGKLNGRLIILIDLNRILQKGELRRMAEVTRTTRGSRLRWIVSGT